MKSEFENSNKEIFEQISALKRGLQKAIENPKILVERMLDRLDKDISEMKKHEWGDLLQRAVGEKKNLANLSEFQLSQIKYGLLEMQSNSSMLILLEYLPNSFSAILMELGKK